MRAIWSGAIGFGLVNIPIRIFSATQDSTLDLDMLDKKDNSNIRFARINESTGKEVEWANIVKGYKYNGDYVVLDDDDFEKVSPEKSKLIEIQEFVQEDQISSMYYETPYYLEPTKGGEKAYALLREALKQSKKVAVGVYVMRTKENLCVLKPIDDMIVLLRLRFAEEIRPTEELNLPKSKVTAAELKMAISLINQLTPKTFSIEKYKDTYDEELLKLIKVKAKKGTVPQPRFKIVRNNKGKDLMAQLKASLETKEPRKKAS